MFEFLQPIAQCTFFMPYYTGQTVENGMACRHLVITPFRTRNDSFAQLNQTVQKTKNNRILEREEEALFKPIRKI